MLISYVSSQLVPSQKQSRIKGGAESLRPQLAKTLKTRPKTTRGPPYHVTKYHQSHTKRPSHSLDEATRTPQSTRSNSHIALATMAQNNHELQSDATRSAANSYSLNSYSFD